MVALDDCLQLHGGYGYMTEYPIGRMWADARVQKIYGGTNEIMIRHDGVVYRMKITRQGKLILNK